jgi:hypothetical protein
MDFVRIFLRRYDWLWARRSEATDVPEELWRARPSGVNSIAWLVWHTARAEDSLSNRLVFDRPQVLHDPTARWPERMNLPLRHHGAGMTSDEVDDLSRRVDVAALRSYSEAVAERLRALVAAVDPEMLDEQPVEPDRPRWLFAEGILRPPLADWLGHPPPYNGWTKGEILLHGGYGHSYGHYHDTCIVGGLLGIQFRPNETRL